MPEAEAVVPGAEPTAEESVPVPPEGATSSEKKDVSPVYVAPGSVEELSGEKEGKEEKPSKKIKLAHSVETLIGQIL